MKYISEDLAHSYYKFLLDCNNMECNLETKIPLLKNKLENEILKEITKKNSFFNHSDKENSQMNWLINNQISGINRNKGFIEEYIVSGIIYIFKMRNIAEHKKEATHAEYIFILFHIAKTINFFSGIPISDQINFMCNPQKLEEKFLPSKDTTNKLLIEIKVNRIKELITEIEEVENKNWESLNIFSKDNKHEYRYFLGTNGNNPLILFGINPSKATGFFSPDSDPTTDIVKNLSKKLNLGHDSCYLINVCPQRAGKPELLDKE